MKKIMTNLCITVIMLSFSSIYAQKPSFGIKGGLNFTSLSKDTDGDDAVGYHAGLIFHAPIKKLGVMVEALYSREGSDKIELDYINVPAMVTYELTKGLRAHLGPQFKVNVSAKYDLSVSNTEGSSVDVGLDIDNEQLDEDIKDLNFDGVVGLEYRVPVIGVLAQLRYVFGLGELGKENVESTQNIFQLSLGYRF